MKDTDPQVDEDLDPTTVASESDALAYFTDAFSRAATDILAEGGTKHDLEVECLKTWEVALAANPKLARLLKLSKRDKLIRERCAKLERSSTGGAPKEEADLDSMPGEIEQIYTA